MELVASMALEHLWLNLVMASPGINCKVPTFGGIPAARFEFSADSETRGQCYKTFYLHH
jgi:hypothetical protein